MDRLADFARRMAQGRLNAVAAYAADPLDDTLPEGLTHFARTIAPSATTIAQRLATDPTFTAALSEAERADLVWASLGGQLCNPADLHLGGRPSSRLAELAKSRSPNESERAARSEARCHLASQDRTSSPQGSLQAPQTPIVRALEGDL